MMNEHIALCRHYSFNEAFLPLKLHDVIFDKGFLMWTNFFAFLRGEAVGLTRKSVSRMKEERK